MIVKCENMTPPPPTHTFQSLQLINLVIKYCNVFTLAFSNGFPWSVIFLNFGRPDNLPISLMSAIWLPCRYRIWSSVNSNNTCKSNQIQYMYRKKKELSVKAVLTHPEILALKWTLLTGSTVVSSLNDKSIQAMFFGFSNLALIISPRRSIFWRLLLFNRRQRLKDFPDSAVQASFLGDSLGSSSKASGEY